MKSENEWEVELRELREARLSATICGRDAQALRTLTYANPLAAEYTRITSKLKERAQAHKVNGTVVVLDIHIENLTEALEAAGFVVTNLGAGTLNETRAAFSSMLKISWDRNGS